MHCELAASSDFRGRVTALPSEARQFVTVHISICERIVMLEEYIKWAHYSKDKPAGNLDNVCKVLIQRFSRARRYEKLVRSGLLQLCSCIDGTRDAVLVS